LKREYIFSSNSERGAKRPKNLCFFRAAERVAVGKNILSGEKPTFSEIS